MVSVKDIVDQYKWDERKNILDLSICYINRTPTTNLAWVNGRAVVRATAGFLELRGNHGNMTYIPFHRVTMIKDKGKIIFDRNKAASGF